MSDIARRKQAIDDFETQLAFLREETQRIKRQNREDSEAHIIASASRKKEVSALDARKTELASAVAVLEASKSRLSEEGKGLVLKNEALNGENARLDSEIAVKESLARSLQEGQEKREATLTAREENLDKREKVCAATEATNLLKEESLNKRDTATASDANAVSVEKEQQARDRLSLKNREASLEARERILSDREGACARSEKKNQEDKEANENSRKSILEARTALVGAETRIQNREKEVDAKENGQIERGQDLGKREKEFLLKEEELKNRERVVKNRERIVGIAE